MSHDSFPHPPAPHRIVRSETDSALSADAQLRNNMRYMYFKKIAQGGKCLIQSCKDLRLGRIVCYKSLLPEFADDPDEQRLFLREARVTAMLQHPNTAPVYEVGLDSRGRHYFTMKLVSGVTLREVVVGLAQGDGRYTETWDLYRLIDVIIQVGQVLSYAHAHSVIHCDVKPGNIVAGSFGEVLLLDWGMAQVADDRPEEEKAAPVDESTIRRKPPVQGTPLYMSPEQVDRRPLDERTDIYSLGAILFEVLTGQCLAWGAETDDMLQNKLGFPPPTPSAVAPDRNIPQALETLCSRCIQRDPDHRVQTVMEMIHELLYWLRTDATYRPSHL